MTILPSRMAKFRLYLQNFKTIVNIPEYFEEQIHSRPATNVCQFLSVNCPGPFLLHSNWQKIALTMQ